MKGKSPNFDVIIIGGGPGGIASAIWCADLGLTSILIERESQPGGQLAAIYNPITNYPAREVSSGREMQAFFVRQVERTPTEMRFGSEVVDIDTHERAVKTSDGERLTASAIILATGVRRRGLQIPGEDEFAGQGILTSGVAARDEVSGSDIVIVGGGDAALENAIILSETARKVTLVHRGDRFSARRDFIERATANPRISVEFNSRLTAIKGRERVENVLLSSQNSGDIASLPCDFVLIRVGVEPNTEFLARKLKLDDGGYVVVNASGETSESGIYAIGDAANPAAPTISGAVGQAATAVKAISRTLFESA